MMYMFGPLEADLRIKVPSADILDSQARCLCPMTQQLWWPHPLSGEADNDSHSFEHGRSRVDLPVVMVIFRSYLSLSEGIPSPDPIPHGAGIFINKKSPRRR